MTIILQYQKDNNTCETPAKPPETNRQFPAKFSLFAAPPPPFCILQSLLSLPLLSSVRNPSCVGRGCWSCRRVLLLTPRGRQFECDRSVLKTFARLFLLPSHRICLLFNLRLFSLSYLSSCHLHDAGGTCVFAARLHGPAASQPHAITRYLQCDFIITPDTCSLRDPVV